MADNTTESGDTDDTSQGKPAGLKRFFGRIRQAAVNPDLGEPQAAPARVPGPDQPGIGNLSTLRIEDVAVPKSEIIAVPVTITKDDLVGKFRESGLTRLPVFNGTLDTPLGFVHLKDLALKHGFKANSGRLTLKQMLRPLLFVPPSMPIGILLAKMQAERVHMALVIDEYGGTDGLVTIEDLIEQVIGEIADEHDVDENELWTLEKPGCYLALAKTPLDEFQAEIDMDLQRVDDIELDDVETLGGLVFMLLGRVPARGEVVKHPSGVEFEIVDADPRRVKRLRAHVQQRPSS